MQRNVDHADGVKIHDILSERDDLNRSELNLMQRICNDAFIDDVDVLLRVIDILRREEHDQLQRDHHVQLKLIHGIDLQL